MPQEQVSIPTTAKKYGLRVTSIGRTPAHNAAVGGVSNSAHLSGQAVDVAGPSSTRQSFVSSIKQQRPDVTQVLDEGDHTHIAWSGEPDVSDLLPDSNSSVATQSHASEPDVSDLISDLPKTQPKAIKPKLPGENLWHQFESAKSSGDLVSAGGYAAQLKSKGWETGADQYGNPYVKPPKSSGYEFKQPRQFEYKRQAQPSLANEIANYQPPQAGTLPQPAPLSAEQQATDRRYANEQQRRSQLSWYRRAAEGAADVVMGTHEDGSRQSIGESIRSATGAYGGGLMKSVGKGISAVGKAGQSIGLPLGQTTELGQGMQQVGQYARGQAGTGILPDVLEAAGEVTPLLAVPGGAPAIGAVSGAQAYGGGASVEDAIKRGILTGTGVAAGGALASRVPFKGITGWAARTGAATAGMEAPQVAATGHVPTLREIAPNALLMGGLEGMAGARPREAQATKGATEQLSPEDLAAGQKWAMEGQTVSLTPEEQLQHQNDAIVGLVQMGFGKKDAAARIAQMTNANPNLSAEQLVRGALGSTSKATAQAPMQGRPTDASEIVSPMAQRMAKYGAERLKYEAYRAEQEAGQPSGELQPVVRKPETQAMMRMPSQIPYQQMAEGQPRLNAPLGSEMPATAQPAQLPPASPEALQENARFVQGPEGVADRTQPVMRVDNQRIIPTGESALAQRLSTYGQQETPTPARAETPRPDQAAARSVEAATPERGVEESAAGQRAKDVVDTITARADYPSESLPDLHDQMNAANVPMHEQVDALNQAGFSFKDTFQLGGTVRALRAEANGETLSEITHRRFGKLLVLGKTPDNNKLITVGADGVIRAPQNPLGVSGNSHIKQFKTADIEKLPTVEWKDLGLQSEGWPTKKQLELLGKLTGKAYGPHLSEVPDDVVKAVWPEVYKKRQLASEFGDKAASVIEDAATQSPPDDAPQFVKDAQARMNERQNTKLDPEAGVNQMIPDLVDAGIVYGHKAYQAGQSFFDWSRGMVKQLGSSIKPHLQSIWAMVKNQMDVKTPGQEGFLSIPPINPAVKQKVKDVARSLYIQGYLGPSGAARVGVGLVAKQTLLDWPANLIGSAIDAATVATGAKSGGRAYEFNVTDIGDVISRGAKRASAAMLNAIQGKTSPTMPHVYDTDIGHPAASAALNAITRIYSTKEAGASAFGYETALNDFASLMARQDPLNLGGSREQRLKHYKDDPPDLAQLQAVAATTTIQTLAQYADVVSEYAAKSRKLTPAQTMQHQAQLMRDPKQLLHEYGLMEADRQVSRQPNAMAKALQNIGKEGVTMGGQQIVAPDSKVAKVLQFVVRAELPFLKRPMNALSQALSDYTGLTAGKKLAAGELQNYLNDTLSKPEQQQFIKSIGKGMTGLGFIGLGLALQKHGAMTGVLDDDKTHFGGALKIGDTYYQIGHVPFIGWLMTFGATLGEAIEKAGQGGASELPGGLIKGTFKMVAEHPMLRGLQTLSETYLQVKSGQVGAGKGLLQHGAQVASRFIPSPIASAAQYMDRDEQGNVIQRSQKGSLVAPFQARIPGQREKLPTVQDRRTGETVSAPFFSPINVRAASQVPDKEQVVVESAIQGEREQAKNTVTDRERVKREITDRLRTGKNVEVPQKQMAEALDRGVLSEDDILDIGRKAGLTMDQQQFNALPLEQAVGALERMPASAREQFKQSFAQKVDKQFDHLPAQDIKRLMPRVQRILQ